MATSSEAPVSIPLGFGAKRHQICFDGGPLMSNQVVQQQQSNNQTIEDDVSKKASYAEKTKERLRQLVDLATLPIPSKRGEKPAIKIPAKYVEKGLEACKSALVGRLDLKNLKIEQIKAEITKEWGLEAPVRISPLGRGYIMVRFGNEDDMKRVWFGGPWYLNKQLVRVLKKKMEEQGKNEKGKGVVNEVATTSEPTLNKNQRKNQRRKTNKEKAAAAKNAVVVEGLQEKDLMKAQETQATNREIIAVVVEDSPVEKSPLSVPNNEGHNTGVMEESLLEQSSSSVPNQQSQGIDGINAVVVEDSAEEQSPLMVPNTLESGAAMVVEESVSDKSPLVVHLPGNDSVGEDEVFWSQLPSTEAAGAIITVTGSSPAVILATQSNIEAAQGPEKEAATLLQACWTDLTESKKGACTEAEWQTPKQKHKKKPSSQGSIMATRAKGDFNVVLRHEEKKGGRLTPNNAIVEFSNWMDNCQLLEAPSSGLKYTWCNHQEGRRRIFSRIDRAFYNSSWASLFSGWQVKVHSRLQSDHAPLIGLTQQIPRPTNSPFKFNKAWLLHENFWELVCHSWSQPVRGAPIFRVQQKLKRLKQDLKVWNKQVFGDIEGKIMAAEQELLDWEELAEDDHENDHTSWKAIIELKREDGTYINDQDQLKAYIVDHFTQKFAHEETTHDPDLLAMIPNVVGEAENNFLTAIPSDNEVTEAVFNLNPDSSPGPDGIQPSNMPKWVDMEDRRVWKHSNSGKFSVAEAYEYLRRRSAEPWWAKKVWRRAMHPRLSGMAWKICRGKIPIDSVIKKHGVNLASRCFLCCKEVEDLDHLIWDCERSKKLWDWLANCFQFQNDFTNLQQALFKCDRSSSLIKDLWNVGVMATMVELWKGRNIVAFQNIGFNDGKVRGDVRKWLRCAHKLSGGSNYSVDNTVMNKLNLSLKWDKAPTVKLCRWYPPRPPFVKLNTDGASRGNPGTAGLGAVIRDYEGNVLSAVCQGLHPMTNFLAECWAIVVGLEWAASQGHSHIWMESDSTAAVQAFGNEKVPWSMEARWVNAIAELHHVVISSTWREVNFSADLLANRGADLGPDINETFVGRPPFLRRVEDPYCCYPRFRSF
ncbi:hypothetical protein FRX31_018863 [Thalictrum thalictroides]|uniref:RNase H type-1 domain-containing protein n=1 Tax=Thalictrum thalictroides TaxID=46969 RepID=A0A7J6W4V9_THATH|nr:hypothetical protein FRX31_018863 [Thalictrum thalictroides]